MTKQILFLKNMLAKSCIKLIEKEFNGKNGLINLQVKMGEMSFEHEHQQLSLREIESLLFDLGFSVIKDNDEKTVEQIKLAAIELIFQANNVSSLIRNSDYISDKLQMPYEKISRIFSKICEVTLEKYLILLKIEKIKELLHNNAFTLSEISYNLSYSSVQYLSNQFKKVTGYTVSEYKALGYEIRIPLEELLENNAYKSFLKT
jgi:AraC-like DNA-binding protein